MTRRTPNEAISDELIQINDAHFRDLLTALPNVSVQGYDRNRQVIYWNKASELLYGYSENEAMGQLLEDLIIPDFMREGVISAHSEWLKSGVSIPPEELELVDKYGNKVAVHSSHVMLNQNTKNPEMFCVDVDLTQQRHKEKQLEYLVLHDRQTGVHNKDSLFRYASLKVDQIKTKNVVGAFFVGIDGLSSINHFKGYKVGDAVISETVSRIKHLAANRGIVARYSGDVFVVLLTSNVNSELISNIVSDFENLNCVPFNIDGEQRKITISAGYFVEQSSNISSIELLQNAEVAMNQAKLSGKNKCVEYKPELEKKLKRDHAIHVALSMAIEKEELHLVFQPQYDQNTNILSCEALLRWENKELGSISPAEFIPQAETNNMMSAIDRWVILNAIKQIRKWLDNGLSPVRVFFNLSGKSLSEPDLIDFIFSELYLAQVPFSLIGIELTEYVLVTENKTLIKHLKRFQNEGGKIALDDFGTGFSSLSYLTKFPLDYIKIDKSFIANLPESANDVTITKAIFALAKSLNMEVICEGIEFQKHMDFIKQENLVGLLQGYLFSKPLTAMRFARHLGKLCNKEV